MGTTQTSVNRWPLAAKRASHIDTLTVPKPSRTIPGTRFGQKSIFLNINKTWFFTRVSSHPLLSGAQGLKKVHVLNDKQHVICTDTEGNATLFDVLHACKVEDLGKVSTVGTV